MPPRLFPCALLLSLCFACTALANRRGTSYYQDLLQDSSPENIREITELLQESQREHEWREIERANKKRRPTHLYNRPAPQLSVIPDAENLRRELAAVNPINFYPLPNPLGHKLRGYAGYNGPYQVPLNPQPPTTGYRSRHQEAMERGMKEEPSPDFGGRYQSLGQQYSDVDVEADAEEPRPDFTYEIAATPRNREELKFAVAPPNEKFYQDGPLNDVDVGSVKVVEHEAIGDKNDDQQQRPTSKLGPVPETTEHESVNSVVPEPKRRAGDPVVMAVAEHKFSNDIYFVVNFGLQFSVGVIKKLSTAVVAGCSAAAMFILVLISLTWCRLQRGAKAAADVEYPAYGVTGPNKDTSPSGDRRLAQSAQMYHYQHQKQQIIAMESRTASGRDPGSVSEAESDEENEEGDYTVYECPGLAPTGEMEVKNPLFHDDPTPATPAGQSQNKRSI